MVKKVSLSDMDREQMGDIWKALLGKEESKPKKEITQ